MRQTPSEKKHQIFHTPPPVIVISNYLAIKMNYRSSAVGKAAIVALLLVMVGLTCNGAPVKRSTCRVESTCDCVDRNRLAHKGNDILLEAYESLEVRT